MSRIRITSQMTLTITILLVVITPTILSESLKAETLDFIPASEWIPMRQPCLTCHDEQSQKTSNLEGDQENEASSIVVQQQEPPQTQQANGGGFQQKSGRVLNTAVTFQRNYSPRQHSQQLHQRQVDSSPESQQFIYNLAPPNGQKNYQPYQSYQPAQTHLTPQFLPHLENANFNAPIFSPNAQSFLPPAPQPQVPRHNQNHQQQQFYLNQPQDDFHLLQQILNSQNGQFANSIFDVPQSIPINQTYHIQYSTELPNASTAIKSTTAPTTTTNLPQSTSSSKPNEEISLLYVPLESLSRQRGGSQNQKKPEVITEKSFTPSYQSLQEQIEQDYVQQDYQAQQLQNQFNDYQSSPPPRSTTLVGIVTDAPKSTTQAPSTQKKKNKLKPHQPPLAVFMNGETDNSNNEVKITDVLSALNSARTIDVLDQIGPKMPNVFVGPSTLKPPEGYAKFELPYLSNLDHNRIQRKVEQLPFFVAPLSYSVPDGYQKIPFPSPHVGSVVIRDMKDLHNKLKPEIESVQSDNTYLNPLLNQFNSNFEIPSFQSQGNQPLSSKYSSNFFDSSPFSQPSAPLRGETRPKQQYQNNPSTSQTPTPTRQQQYFTESVTPLRQAQHFTEPTMSAFISSQNNAGALDNYYFTKSTPRPADIESKRRPYKIGSDEHSSNITPPQQQLTSSTASSVLDYTILEQFPIRESHSTTPSSLYRGQQPQKSEKIIGNQQYQTQPKLTYKYTSDITAAHVTQLPDEISATIQPNNPIRYQTPNVAALSTIVPTEPSPTVQSKNNAEVYTQQLKNSYTLETQPKLQPQFYQEQIPFSPIHQLQTHHAPQYEQQYQPESQSIFPDTINSAPYQQTPKIQYHQNTAQDQNTPQYNLSSLLPPINPQLPSLINSLQDEQASISSPSPGGSSTSDSYPKSSTQQSTLAQHETYTRRPVVRGRQRHPSLRPVSPTESPTSGTTPRSRGTTPQRRRRPQYNGRPRQEYDNSGEQPNYPRIISSTSTTTTTTTTTAAPPAEIVTVTSPRTTRGRYNYQSNAEHSTELPRRNIVTRTRFRTRGRQTTTTSTTTTTPEPPVVSSTTDNEGLLNGHQNNAALTERSFAYTSAEQQPNSLQHQFQQPKFEGGFQVSQDYLNPTPSQTYQQQPYVEQQYDNDRSPQSDEVSKQNYYNTQQYQQQGISSTQQYENQQDDTSYPTTTQNVRYVDINSYSSGPTTPSGHRNLEPEIITRPINGQSSFVRYNNGQQQNSFIQSPGSEQTTNSRRQNQSSRIKNRPRGRIYTSTPSQTEQPIRIPSTTTQKIDAKQNDEQEFYGFFRTPSFAPPSNEPVKSTTVEPQYFVNPSSVRPTYDQNIVRSSTIPPKYSNPSIEQQFNNNQNQYYSQSENPVKYYTQTENPVKYYSQSENPNKYLTQTESPNKYYSPQTTDISNNFYLQTENPNNPYFSQTERASTESAETIYVDGSGRYTSPSSVSYYPETNQNDEQAPVYVAPSSTDKSEEIQTFNDDITTEKKLQKQYFISSKIPSTNRRPITSTQYYPSTTIRTTANNRYTVRPSTKPNSGDTPKVVKIRGRMRKPISRTTTTTEEAYDDDAASGELLSQQYEERISSPAPHSEAYTQHIEQNVGKFKKRPTTSRGQVNYRKTVGDNVSGISSSEDDDGIEGQNYPQEFLVAHDLSTKRPEFKITVGPFEQQGESSYSDQIPYQSISRPNVVIRNPEDGVSESQWTAKYTTTSFFRKPNSNDIPVQDKQTINSDLNNSSSSENITVNTSSTENVATTEGKSIFEQIFDEMAKFGMGNDESTTTIEAITESNTDVEGDVAIGEIKVRKGKRRGYWKRVRVRPVDGLQVAESQNIVAATNLISDSAKKIYPRPTIEQYVISFEQPENKDNTQEIKETTVSPIKNLDYVTVLPISTNLTDILFDDITNTNETVNDNRSDTNTVPNLKETITSEVENKTEKSDEIKATTESADDEIVTTEMTLIQTTIPNLLPDIITENEINETNIIAEKLNDIAKKIEEEINEEKKLDITDPFVLGTSTSTEISHETEICYRGRCVKSNSTSSAEQNDSNRGPLL